ncbi:hypothetical protein M9Y10_042038 [Tritrichomonas musculus]|uniref:Protein kinase domain-containing protein n=1 Tax=Tritrichomonas musculus TaxID=1915356 RepID=A0ABR2K631_9EUKA
MPNGSLQDFLDKIRKNKQFNKKYKCKKHAILIGIAFSMTYLHKLKIVHRDLKRVNILLDENFRPKISDFGTAIIYIENTKFKKMQEKAKAGSYLYMAPEIHQ